MLTTRSISAGGATNYAEYLEAMTVTPEAGDYYLGSSGQPVAAPGQWLTSAEMLQALGVDGEGEVDRDSLIALMQGRRPDSEEWLRRAGPNGKRNAGVDMVFSAPKSVSVVWGLGGPQVREAIERAHVEAVREVFGYVRDTVPALSVAQELVPAADLHAATFVHTTARAVAGRMPDPQLHSHVLVMSGVDGAGQVRAVRDATLYRAALEGGAYYRAALASRLADAGFALRRNTGKKGRYFELAGVDDDLVTAFSARHRELVKLEADFEARMGRKATENELSVMEVDSRAAKLPQTEQQLTDAWRATAAKHGVHDLDQLMGRGGPLTGRDPEWGQRVEDALTAERSTFGARELRARALEQAAGAMAPHEALRRVDQLLDSGRVIALEGRRLTTRTLRLMEQAALDSADRMLLTPGHTLRDDAVDQAIDHVAERLGSPLSNEQRAAVKTLAGPERVAALEGEAGTGKGVVLDALARAEHHEGRRVVGVAVAGRTAQRLAEESPALAGQTMTAAALLARTGNGGTEVLNDTTVIVDEAGMVDTPTMHALLRTVEQRQARVLLVGDRRQLDAIGAGGMFAQLAGRVPLAKVTRVRRTDDPAERTAWAQLRRGQAREAMAHYVARGDIHLHEERQHALHSAAQRYDELASFHGHHGLALMSDGPTSEIERLNGRVQRLRLKRGELGEPAVALPAGEDVPTYELHAGDVVTWRAIQHASAKQQRVENGTRGTITAVDAEQDTVSIEVAGSARQVVVAGDELGVLRLGYASSVYRQQGATVDRAVALTGGWQADRAGAYVQASRARHGIDWFVAKEDLGEDGTEQITELARRMSIDRSKTASVAYGEATERPTIVHRRLEQPADRLGGPGVEDEVGVEAFVDPGPLDDLGVPAPPLVDVEVGA